MWMIVHLCIERGVWVWWIIAVHQSQPFSTSVYTETYILCPENCTSLWGADYLPLRSLYIINGLKSRRAAPCGGVVCSAPPSGGRVRRDEEAMMFWNWTPPAVSAQHDPQPARYLCRGPARWVGIDRFTCCSYPRVGRSEEASGTRAYRYRDLLIYRDLPRRRVTAPVWAAHLELRTPGGAPRSFIERGCRPTGLKMLRRFASWVSRGDDWGEWECWWGGTVVGGVSDLSDWPDSDRPGTCRGPTARPSVGTWPPTPPGLGSEPRPSPTQTDTSMLLHCH